MDEIQAHQITLPITYHYDLYRPFEKVAPSALIIALHGYGQSKKTSMMFARSVRQDWPVAALQAPHPHHIRQGGRIAGTGFGWVSSFRPELDIANHHAFIQRVIGEAHAQGLTDEKRAFLFGFSQSVSLNYRFAAAHPDFVKGVIAVAGATPSDWPEPAEPGPRLELPILHISMTEDRAYPKARAEHFKRQLEARAQTLTWHEEAGEHRVPKAAYGVIRAWLDKTARGS